MASRSGTVEFIVEQAAGAVQPRKMFGEYGLFSGDKMVALVCDDQLYIKPTAAGRAFAGQVGEGRPYPGAKPYLLIPGDCWEEEDWLAQLLRLTAEGLPAPTRKSNGRRSTGK